MRRAGAVLVVAGAAGVLASAAPAWFTAPVSGISRDTVSVTGFAAAPGLTALLLVIAAGLVARLLARGAVARVLGVATVVAGAALLASVLSVLGGADGALRSAAAAETGVAELAGPAAMTVWPVVCAVAAAALVVGLAAVALRASRGRQDRYERSGAPAQASPVSDWDALSRGEDPSEGDRPPAPGGDGPLR